MEKKYQPDDEVMYRFTAYLRTAVLRKRREYISKLAVLRAQQTAFEEWEAAEGLLAEMDLTEELSLEDQIESQSLALAISDLPADEYRVLHLHIVYGLSHKESAEMLSQNFWTVKGAYLRAIKKLRQAMEGGANNGISENPAKSKKRKQ